MPGKSCWTDLPRVQQLGAFAGIRIASAEGENLFLVAAFPGQRFLHNGAFSAADV
jgi:hypothetical protein